MAQVSAEAVFETTASACGRRESCGKAIRRFDIFFYLICTALVTLDTVGAVAANGAQGFASLVFLGVFFLLPPYASLIADLARVPRQEGGPYMWTRLAFGARWRVNSFIYSISNPIWVGGR